MSEKTSTKREWQRKRERVESKRTFIFKIRLRKKTKGNNFVEQKKTKKKEQN